jgi:glucose-6-phosphate-specific signal transduction histidine kinase
MGFDFSPASTGFGILGMQKRARNVGSTLEIFSTPGAGTQVRVRASLQEVKLRNRMISVVKNRFKHFAPFAANR